MNDTISLMASSSWAPLLQTAFGALIGFAVAVAGVVFGAWSKEQLRRQSLAAALAAEVEAVTELTGHHMVVEVIHTCIASMEANGKPEYPRFSIQDHPLPVFEESVGKLGLLPVELARDVRTFYTYAIAAVQAFRTLYNANLYDRPVDELISFLQEMVHTINRGFALAKTLVPKLEHEAKRTWNEPQQWSAPRFQQVFGAMYRLPRTFLAPMMSFQKQSISQKTTPGCAPEACGISEFDPSCIESGRYTLSPSALNHFSYFRGAPVGKRQTDTATCRQPRFGSLHRVNLSLNIASIASPRKPPPSGAIRKQHCSSPWG